MPTEVLLKYETNLNKYLIVRLDLCLGIIKECNYLISIPTDAHT